jgi:stage V sporulation protein R
MSWDTKEMKGEEKIREIMRSYTDWFFMQDFLTSNLVDKLNLYVFRPQDMMTHIDYVRTGHKANDVRQLIVNSFAHSGIPKIVVKNGNVENKGVMFLLHKHSGANLDKKYAEETLQHIYRLWGRPVLLETKNNDQRIIVKVESESDKRNVINSDSTFFNPFEQTNFFQF